MDAKVFRMAILTIISAFILVLVIIYATNADKINRLFNKGEKEKAAEAITEEVLSSDAYSEQQIGDDLKAFLYEDDFFDEAEEIPAVVVIQHNTRTVDSDSEASSEDTDREGEDEGGAGMAVVGQLDNPSAMQEAADRLFPESLSEPPVEGTPVGTAR